MKNSLTLYLILAALSANILCARETKKKETINKTFTFDSKKQKRLVLDNIAGRIEISTHDKNQIKMIVHKVVTARSEEKIKEAEKKIYLDIKSEPDAVILYVEAPYRTHDGAINHRGWNYYGFDTSFDFKLKVPKNVDLFVRTINGGDIRIENTHGSFDVKNINGGITARGISGSGKMYALNGDVEIRFTQNPDEHCYFGSLNGVVDVQFLPGLSADLRIKTFNGEVYSDFEVTKLKSRQPIRKKEGQKFTYKIDKSTGVRIGNGGPEFEFDAFNGDIYIAKK